MITAPLQSLSALIKTMARTAKKSPLPIIECVALRCEGGNLSVIANDMQRCASESIPVDGEMESCCVVASALNLALSNLRGENVTLEHDKNKLTVKAGRSRITLDTLRYEDFPQPVLKEERRLGITPAQLATAVSSVAYAAGSKDVRYYINGIHIDGKNTVATDGHRQAWHPLICDTEQGLIIPNDAVSDIKERTNGTAVTATENQLIIKTQTGWYSTQLIDGKYPDYERVIPRYGNASTVTVNAAELTAALRTVSTVAIATAAKFIGCKMLVTQPGTLTLEGLNTQAELAAEISGAPVEIGVCPTYILDAANAHTEATGSDTVTLEWETANQAITVGNAVIMPMRI